MDKLITRNTKIIIIIVAILILTQSCLGQNLITSQKNLKDTTKNYFITSYENDLLEVWANSSWTSENGFKTGDNVTVYWPREEEVTIGETATNNLDTAIGKIRENGKVYVLKSEVYYKTPLPITKSVTIWGENRNIVRIDNHQNSKVKIDGNHINLINLSIINCSYGTDSYNLEIINSSKGIISGCIFDLGDGGIDIRNSNDITVQNCDFLNARYGLYISDGTYGLNISHNTFFDSNRQLTNYIAILMMETEGNELYNNTIINWYWGIAIGGASSFNNISHCGFYDNTFALTCSPYHTADPIPKLYYADNNNIKNNIFQNNFVHIWMLPFTYNNRIYQNEFIYYDNFIINIIDSTFGKNWWYDQKSNVGNLWSDWGPEPNQHFRHEDNIPYPNGDGFIDSPRPIPYSIFYVLQFFGTPLISFTKDLYPIGPPLKPEVKITYPFGGEVFKDDELEILWKASHNYLRKENKNLSITISIINYWNKEEELDRISGLNNTGNYTWNIPREIFDNPDHPTTITCQINITATTRNTKTKTSHYTLSRPFTIDRDGPIISPIIIKDVTIDSTEYTSDGHKVIVETAIVAENTEELTVTPDLSQLGTDIYEKRYENGSMYIWIINNTNCNPPNDYIDITITASTKTETCEGIARIKADNTKPNITLTKPIGICIFDFGGEPKINLPLKNSLIIGPVTIKANAEDPGGSSIDRVEFYIDDLLMYTTNSKPYTWKWDKAYTKYCHTIKIKAYDKAGNSQDVEQEVIRII